MVLATTLCGALACAPTGVAAIGTEPAAPDDLAHPTMTATGDLSATLVSPAPGGSAAATTAIEVSTERGGGVELRVDGRVVPSDRIGKRTVDTKTGETHFFYYGIALEPGPNVVELVPLGASGARGKPVTATVFGPGPATSMAATLGGPFVADGRTAAILKIALLDASGRPALGSENVRLTLAGDATIGGRLRSTQARAENDGTVEFPLVAGIAAGGVDVRAETESGIARNFTFRSLPYLRVPIVTGIVTGGIGAVPGIPGTGDGQEDGTNARRARFAIFGTGRVLHDAALTFAYDTANVLDRTIDYGSFSANPDARPYLTYGDTSIRRDDALSRDRLFFRFTRGTTEATWGRFRATTTEPGAGAGSLGGLDLLVSGAQIETGTKNVRVAAFHAADDIAYGRQVFAPTGLALLAGVLHPDIVVASDVVELVTLDRHTGVVVGDVGLIRNVDYVLDYATGELRFLNPPMPFDERFNPQQILVRYEYSGLRGGAATTGGRISTTFGRGNAYRAAAGYVNDATGGGNATLISQDFSGPISGGRWRFEHLATKGGIGSLATTSGSTTVAGTSLAGDAFRAALETALLGSKLTMAYEQTTSGYYNPFGGLATPGLTSLRAELVRAIPGGTLGATVDRERNVGVGYGNAVSNAQIALKKRVGRKLTLGAQIARHDYSSGTSFARAVAASQDVAPVATPVPVAVAGLGQTNPSGSVTQASLAVGYRFSPALDASFAKTIDVAGTSDAAAGSPPSTQAELGIAFGTRGRAYVRELWNAAPTSSFAASTVALTTQTSGTRSTAIGFERALGRNTTVDSEYLVQQTATGADVFAAIGGKERFQFAHGVTGSLDVQRANAIGSGLSGFDLYGANLAYKPKDGRFVATANYQLRTGDAPGSTLALGGAGDLGGGVSLIATLNDATTVGYRSDRDRVSLAVRPLHDDRSVTLFAYERENGNATTIDQHAEILSLEHDWRPTRVDEFSTRLAYKLDGDSYYAAHTSLLDARVDHRLGGPTGRLDLGIEGRTLTSGNGVPGGFALGAAAEAGYTLDDAMRLAVGYDVSAAPDPALAVASRRAGFYATFTSAITNVFGWGKR